MARAPRLPPPVRPAAAAAYAPSHHGHAPLPTTSTDDGTPADEAPPPHGSRWRDPAAAGDAAVSASTRRSPTGRAGPRRRESDIMPLGPRTMTNAEQQTVDLRRQRTMILRRRSQREENWDLGLTQWGTMYPPRRRGCGGLNCPAANAARPPEHANMWVSPAPPVAVVLFQLMLLKGIKMIECVNAVPREEMMAVFTQRAGDGGRVCRAAFHDVLRLLCRAEYDEKAADRLFDLFDRDHSGDVDLKEFQAGLSIIMDTQCPDDSLQYFFGLLDTNKKFPRYITKFELQTLVNTYCHHRKTADAGHGAGVAGSPNGTVARERRLATALARDTPQ
eukprot:gene46365-14079_t